MEYKYILREMWNRNGFEEVFDELLNVNSEEDAVNYALKYFNKGKSYYIIKLPENKIHYIDDVNIDRDILDDILDDILEKKDEGEFTEDFFVSRENENEILISAADVDRTVSFVSPEFIGFSCGRGLKEDVLNDDLFYEIEHFGDDLFLMNSRMQDVACYPYDISDLTEKISEIGDDESSVIAFVFERGKLKYKSKDLLNNSEEVAKVADFFAEINVFFKKE